MPGATATEPLARDAVGEPLDHLGNDILREDAAADAHTLRQAHRIIAVARADVGDGHAGPHVGRVHDILGLVDAVARFLGRPFGRDRRRDGPVGGRKVARGLGAVAAFVPRRVIAAAEQRQQRQRGKSGDALHQSISSTSTFSPVTFCDSAAAMKGSSAPSSTSPGAVEVTPVRRSFTS